VRQRAGCGLGPALCAALLALSAAAAHAGAAGILPLSAFQSARTQEAPVANAAFVPGADSTPAAAFAGTLSLGSAEMKLQPPLEQPLIGGRDARIFPRVTLGFVTLGNVLVPLERGEMVRESTPGATPSYWRVIPQFGRVWHEKADGEWSRAAFPIMLVNDTENHAHQGLATFLYRRGEVTGLMVQFVQQTAPYLTMHLLVAWGYVPAKVSTVDSRIIASAQQAAKSELADRLPSKPWADLLKTVTPGTLDGFGGPLYPKWRVIVALVRDGTLYYQDSQTPYGTYPYPLEMRFGVRSETKSVIAPLALLRLAQVYGPWILTLNVGDYVPGLDPKWRRIRFIDVANMTTGFGGTGSLKTHPNDIFDGYLEGNYDSWYTAPTLENKLREINANLHPYPWQPGTVMRYRDQDYFLLGVAIDRFLKSVRGPQADLWKMVQTEVLEPIGIHHAPAVRTREADGSDGVVWCNAGYYPTLDDMAKIALLYQARGEHAGVQILNRELTTGLLAGRNAIVKRGDASLGPEYEPADETEEARYLMGFHFIRYESAGGQVHYLPSMHGSGDNELIIYPNGMISLVMAKAAQERLNGEKARSDEGPVTIRDVEKLAAFSRRP
jgi:CubicO group peptidase (beta-lactamase class C family)